MSTPSGAYQLAKVVAARIAETQGATARELYRLFGTGFAEFGCDGSSASAMIAQHLAKFEQEGLVIGEKKGRERSAPKTWMWVGPKPKSLDTPVADEPLDDAAMPETDAGSTVDADQIQESATNAATEACVEPDGCDRAIVDFEEALLTLSRMFRAQRRSIARRDEKVACLARLAEITAPDIAELLREIAEDIQ